MIAWFSTKGAGSNDALRLQSLLSGLHGAEEFPFDRANKRASFRRLLTSIRRRRPRLLVMEGTGIAGGGVCLAARLLWKIPYVVSSGDAVGPFVAAHSRTAGPLFALYERILCRFAAGFIGWTPYLCGRALSFGCRRAVTAAGWPLGGTSPLSAADARNRYRMQFGIGEDRLVVGIVGSLEWNSRRRYCYGWDLVEAAHRVGRADIAFLIVGGGSGLPKLRERAGALLGQSVFLPGPIALDEVVPCLGAMDIAALPQSLDGVGTFRYTTKISEYAAARLPVITSQIPMAYDLGLEWMWRLPGAGPWEEDYVNSLVELLSRLTTEDVSEKRSGIPSSLPDFDQESQNEKVSAFITDILRSS